MYEIIIHNKHIEIIKAKRGKSKKISFEEVYELSKKYKFIYKKFGNFAPLNFSDRYCGYYFCESDKSEVLNYMYNLRIFCYLNNIDKSETLYKIKEKIEVI